MAFLLKVIVTWALASFVAFAAPTPTYPWEARHGLTADEYQTTFNDLVGQGYRLNYVSGYTVNNDPRYAAVWEKKESPEWTAKHGMTSDEYQTAFNNYGYDGYRLVLVNGYTVGGEDRYVAIWDKSTSGEWVARHRMTASDYQTAFDNYYQQGYRLKHVSYYAIGSDPYYAAIWEKSDDTSEWVARHGLTSDQYQQAYDNYTSQGYRLVLVSGCGINDVDYYAAIWEKRDGPNWAARHGLTATQYQSEFDNYTSQGYIPRVVSGYTINYEDRYAAILEQYSTPY